MTLKVPIALALALVSLAPLAATDQWPRFRGTQAGLVADDPALPDTWSDTENVVWKTDIPGLGWSSPVVWDDHVFITSAVSTGKEATPIPGLYDPGDDQGSVKSSSVNRWMVYDVDFDDRKGPLGHRNAQRHAADRPAHQEHVRVGDRRHRRRTRLRVPGEHRRAGRARHEGSSRLDS